MAGTPRKRSHVVENQLGRQVCREVTAWGRRIAKRVAVSRAKTEPDTRGGSFDVAVAELVEG